LDEPRPPPRGNGTIHRLVHRGYGGGVPVRRVGQPYGHRLMDGQPIEYATWAPASSSGI
jgi:hypothetical protein